MSSKKIMGVLILLLSAVLIGCFIAATLEEFQIKCFEK